MGRKDLSIVYTPDATDDDLSNIQTFVEKEPHEVKVIKKFLQDVSHRADLGGNAFVELDEATLAGRVCLISADARKDKSAEDITVAFRCDFESALSALNALQKGTKTPRQHRNDAVKCGGVWQSHVIDHIQPHSSGIDIAALPKAPKKPLERHRERHKIAVFRTADISLEALNNFVKEVYQDVQEPEDSPFITFVTQYSEKPFTEGSHKGDQELREVPPLSEELKHATPEECGELINRRMCTQRDLDLEYFVIMDHLTEKRNTVILACQCEDENDGELTLLRCSFGQVMEALMAVYVTGLSFEAAADEAAREPDGVRRMTEDDEDDGSEGGASGSEEWEDDDE